MSFRYEPLPHYEAHSSTSVTSHSQPRALTLHSAVPARASTRIVVALQYMQMVALPTLLTGARLAACGEKEACGGGGQERAGA